MRGTLVFVEGPLAGRRVEVEGELVLGREDASLTIEDEEISRRHAVIRPSGGGIEIEDLGSTNGTYVNGARIGSTTRLAGGDTIRIGRTVLQLESRAAATVAAAVPAAPVAASAAPAPARTAPAAAFGAYAAPAVKRSRGVASRQLGPQLVSFAVIAATAVALVLYFADR
jgi:predicted component of type VI protein secretion system